jgi:hypothetical protein
MNTAIVKREFEGHAIEFDLHNKNVMVNATDMTKIYGKRIGVFLKTIQTKEFILALKGALIGAPLAQKNDKVKFTPKGVNLEENEDPEIISFRGRNGTYFHRILALKYAAWLNPRFEVWVYMTIEDILFKKQEEIKALNPRKEFVPYFIPDELVYHGKVTVDEMSKDLMRRVLDIAEYYNIKTGNVNGWLFKRAQILYEFKVSKHHYYSADGYSKFATVVRMGVFHCILYIAQNAHDFIVKLNPKIAPRPHLIKAEDCKGLYYINHADENYGRVYN